jgi:predicted nuclease of predicted toxin-antitoxin system
MIWIDAQLSPSLAPWIRERFNIEARPVRELNLRDAEDEEIFNRGKTAGTIVMTKDSDFVVLVGRLGPPPQILWITCGNTSNSHLKHVLAVRLAEALALLAGGEPMVEISGP